MAMTAEMQGTEHGPAITLLGWGEAMLCELQHLGAKRRRE
jgi:hypothetical protein